MTVGELVLKLAGVPSNYLITYWDEAGRCDPEFVLVSHAIKQVRLCDIDLDIKSWTGIEEPKE